MSVLIVEDAAACADRVFAVVTAAGSGTRLGADCPKALVELAGQTLVVRAVSAMFAHPQVAAVVVTAPVTVLPRVAELFASDRRVLVVAGGEQRQDSVRLGLAALPGLAERCGAPLHPTSPVLIHDAARPLTPVTVVDRVVAAVRAGADGVVPVVPVVDTLVRVESSERADQASDFGVVVDLVPREQVRAVQTPQGFGWAMIWRAHCEGQGAAATDDATLVRRIGGVVQVCAGSEDSLKVTTAFDLAQAQTLVTERQG